ncbi:MAG: carbamate kinase, partial [Phycisphaerae bacterium]|nr:carbamate kinase [Phycisphaerae bacterium]
VPSPLPRAIVEIDLIRRLANAGEILVTAGGGGIPVARTESGALVGVEAVIDKDRTSGLLARAIDAAVLLICTNVSRVAVNYQTPSERFLDHVTHTEIRRYYLEGQFPPGSMGPKVEAAIDFLEGSRRRDACVIICDLEHMADALAGRAGTWITKD